MPVVKSIAEVQTEKYWTLVHQTLLQVFKIVNSDSVDVLKEEILNTPEEEQILFYHTEPLIIASEIAEIVPTDQQSCMYLRIRQDILIGNRAAATYGLIAAAYLAQNDGWIPAKDVATTYGLPEKCMFNAMGDLARGGILRGKKGVGGGFALARPAKEISMLDIIEAAEGPLQSIMKMVGATKDTPLVVNMEKVCEQAISKAKDRFQKAKLSKLIC